MSQKHPTKVPSKCFQSIFLRLSRELRPYKICICSDILGELKSKCLKKSSTIAAIVKKSFSLIFVLVSND